MTEAVLEEQVELLLNEALHHHSAGRRTRYHTVRPRERTLSSDLCPLITAAEFPSDRPALNDRAGCRRHTELRFRLLTGEQRLMGCSGGYYARLSGHGISEVLANGLAV